MSATLTTVEKSDFGIRLYDVSPAHRGTALMTWEQSWLSRRLPAAPARILVGACGAGRELLALTTAGYAVDAFEPAPTLFQLARTRTTDRARVYSFRYEDLSAAVLDGARNAAAQLAGQRYDAVLLGWGSLAHVLDEADRLRLMRALDRLCPGGPLLASFWCDDARIGTPAVGRAERYATACGHWLARVRNSAGAASPRESFTMHAGFAYRFTRSEIEALAALVDRSVLWEDDETDYPHATFAKAGGVAAQ